MHLLIPHRLRSAVGAPHAAGVPDAERAFYLLADIDAGHTVKQVRVLTEASGNVGIVAALGKELLDKIVPRLPAAATTARTGAAATVLHGEGGHGHVPPVPFLTNQAGLVDSDVVKEDGVLDRLNGGAGGAAGGAEGTQGKQVERLN